jgi:REP element-mobilizing transposase RayT
MPEAALPNRQSIRLKDYDYSSPGAYFVTICTWQKKCVLGEIIDSEMQLNEAGKIANSAWRDLPNHYRHVRLDESVVMPNHFHGIIWITGSGFKPDRLEIDSKRAGLKPAPTRWHALPEVIRGFKSFSARQINVFRQTPGTSVWQRNYYERVIRNEEELNRAREYILNNPRKWALDEENPQRRHEP